jgi:predicted NBD/HSP70 family sugar kinase
MWRPPPTIGVDIGGSHIRGVRWNGKRVVKALVADTPSSLPILRSLIARLVGELTPRFGAAPPIGIGCAGVISGNVVMHSANLPFLQNLDVEGLVPDGRSAVLENDARAFLWGEYLHGAGIGARRLMGFTFGTGVGRAFGENGAVLPYHEFEMAEAWEPAYQQIFDRQELARFLAEHLAPLIKNHDPELLVVGGGAIGRNGDFLRTFGAALSEQDVRVPIRRSQFGARAGAVGAAAYAALRFAPPQIHR